MIAWENISGVHRVAGSLREFQLMQREELPQTWQRPVSLAEPLR